MQIQNGSDLGQMLDQDTTKWRSLASAPVSPFRHVDEYFEINGLLDQINLIEVLSSSPNPTFEILRLFLCFFAILWSVAMLD